MRGNPGQDYYRAARQWLIRAGRRPDVRPASTAPDGAPALELLDQQAAVEVGQVTELPLSVIHSNAAPDQFPEPAPK